MCSRYNLSLNLLFFLYLFFKSSFDSLNVRLSNHIVTLFSSFKLSQYSFSTFQSSHSSSSSIKNNKKTYSPKHRWLVLILILNCTSQLNANPSRSSNSSSLNLSWSLESFMNRLLNSTLETSSLHPFTVHSNSFLNLSYSPSLEANTSIFKKFSSHLMSFLSSNQPNNTHNQVVNQLSDQASNGSELELFRKLNLLSKSIVNSVIDSARNAISKRTTNRTRDLDHDGNRIKSVFKKVDRLNNNEQIITKVDSIKFNGPNESVTNSIINSNEETINGHRHIPVHKLMLKDELKFFFDDQNKEINSEVNIPTRPTDRQNELKNQTVLIAQNESGQLDNDDEGLNSENYSATKDSSSSVRTDKSDNENIRSSQSTFNGQKNVSDIRQDATGDKILSHDYELLDINEIKFHPNILTSSQQTNPTELKLSFNIFNRTFELDLQLNSQLFAPNFSIQKSDNKLSQNLKLKNLNCFYHGTLSIDSSLKSPEQMQSPVSTSRSMFSSNEQHSNSSKSVVSLSNCGELRGLLQTDDYLYVINPLNEQLIRRYNLKNRNKLSKGTLFVKRTKNKDLINNLAKQITNQVKAKKVKQATGHKYQINDSSVQNLNVKNYDQLRTEEVKVNKQQLTGQTNALRTKRSIYGNIRLDYQNPTIELAVFGDESLYNYLKNTYFIKTDHQIVYFVLTILNGIQSLYNQFHKYDINLKFNIVLLEIFQKQPKDLVPTDLQEKYLFRFCDWQAKRKYENTRSRFGHWDHAFLLTALNLARYDKETNVKVDSVIGSALVGKMCTESSCSIGEGTLLGTILVMAHEIAHSMDLSHDGDMEHSGTNNCQNEKYIMTSSLGPGVYSFSPCSARELKDYLRKPNAKCLFVNNSKLRLKRKFLNEFHITNEDDVLGSWEQSNLLAGQAYSMDDQCILVFGENAFYAPTKYYTLCEAVTCSTHEGIRYAHPTLEGTVCGYEKWCQKGECVRSNLTQTDSKDILNNEISSSNAYSIDFSNWKIDENRKPNKTTTIQANKSKPKWKIFENNHDTSVNKRLLNNRSKNETLLTGNQTDDRTTDTRVSHKATKSVKMKIDLKKNVFETNSTVRSRTDSRSETSTQIKQPSNHTNLASHWISLFDKRNEIAIKALNQRWSNWSNWSECVSECLIAGELRQPLGFQISTRKCNSNNCTGSKIRLKLCDAQLICSKRSLIRTLDQYVNSVCDISSNFTNQSDQVKVNGCFIKNCSNNELVFSHELSLPNTTPCQVNESIMSAETTNGYCFDGECRNFDCSGMSEATDTKPCNKTTVEFVVKQNSNDDVNLWHPLSYCKQSCLLKSSGIQLVYQDHDLSLVERKSFQLCSTAEEDCLKRELKPVNEYANDVCIRYKSKYPLLLSGKGKQLPPRKDNIHSSCIVFCADLKLPNVYYEMNSVPDGQFPLGTNCTFNSSVQSYCIDGKCVHFGHDLTPINKTEINNFSNLRKQFPREMMYRNRH